jgi:hypothetical protein
VIKAFEVLDKLNQQAEDYGELRMVQLSEEDVKVLRAALNATIVIKTPPIPESEVITYLRIQIKDLHTECIRMERHMSRAMRIEQLLDACKAVLIERYEERDKDLIDAINEVIRS